ncbi:MAG: PQQ-binding-like beta-propeller repeat protein [Zavarzinella sp.]
MALLLLWQTGIMASNSSNKNMMKLVFFITLISSLVWFVLVQKKPKIVWRAAFLVVIFSVPNIFLVYVSMDGEFFPIIRYRDWVLNTFFGGSHEQRLKKHREEQGKSTIVAKLTPNTTDVIQYRGPDRGGVYDGPPLSHNWDKQPPKMLWRQPVGGGYASFVTANGCLITLEQRKNENGEDQEMVVCYEAVNGKEIWTSGWNALFSERLGGDGPRSTPTIANGDVFALGATGKLVCIDGENGKQKWAVETLENNENITWGMSGSPLVIGDQVIVNPGSQTEASKGSAVRSYDRNTGKLQWQAGSYQAGYCSPQVAKIGEDEQILIFDADGLAGHQLSDGKELWRFHFPTYMGINVAQPVVIDDHTIFIGAGYGAAGVCINVTKSENQWQVKEKYRTSNKVMRLKMSPAVRLTNKNGDYLYGLDDGVMQCMDLATGKQKWRDDRRAKKGQAYGHGQIAASDGVLIILTEYGELVLVDATETEFREIGRIDALTRGPKTWTVPIIVDGILYVRNEEQMAAFDLRQ